MSIIWHYISATDPLHEHPSKYEGPDGWTVPCFSSWTSKNLCCWK